MSIKVRLRNTLLVALFVFASTAGALAKTIPLDGIVAIVDEDVILKSELDSRVTRIKQGIEPSRLPPEDVLIQQVLERLIVENLQLQIAYRVGVRVSDQELNEALKGIAAQNGMQLNQFLQAIRDDGIEYTEMREQIKNEVLISRVQNGIVNNRIKVTDQEVKNFLESEVGAVVTSDEYRVLHILIAVDEDAEAGDISDARSRTQQLLDDLANGDDFQKLARAHSAGQNALEGGNLGWRKPVQLPTIFSDKVSQMKVGEVVGPIKSASGFHVIKLAEKRGAESEGQVAQTRSRHILIQPSEIRSDRQAKELAESLLAQVKAGEDFTTLAQLHSDDPSSALSGGDLSWNQAGVFVPEFEAALARLEIDEISEVFKTEHGYHFVQVTGRRVEDFSEEYKRGQAVNYLRSRKFEEELEAWLVEIRAEAFVEIRI
jgi:peptidyl-prolyl cis-trans isomerase SurA